MTKSKLQDMKRKINSIHIIIMPMRGATFHLLHIVALGEQLFLLIKSTLINAEIKGVFFIIDLLHFNPCMMLEQKVQALPAVVDSD